MAACPEPPAPSSRAGTAERSVLRNLAQPTFDTQGTGSPRSQWKAADWKGAGHKEAAGPISGQSPPLASGQGMLTDPRRPRPLAARVVTI